MKKIIRMLLFLMAGFFQPLSARRGLENKGNTCFMNGALQALYTILPLRDYIINNGRKWYKDPVIRELSQVFEEMQKTGQPAVDPDKFVNVVWSDKFPQGRQGDSHEFVTFLFDRLDEGLDDRFRADEKRLVKEYLHRLFYTEGKAKLWHKSFTGGSKDSSSSEQLFLQLNFPLEYKTESVTLKRLIVSHLAPEIIPVALKPAEDYIKAVGDDIGSIDKVDFRLILLILLDHRAIITDDELGEVILKFFALKITKKYPQLFDGSVKNKKDVEDFLSSLKDSLRVDVVKRIDRKLSPYLFIHLVRHSFDQTTLEPAKIRTQIKDLKPDLKIHGEQYQLKAIVIHSGTTLMSGHYYAFTRDNGQWLSCNDNSIQTTAEATVTSHEENSSATYYILIYQREGIIPADEDTALQALEQKINDHLVIVEKTRRDRASLESLNYELVELHSLAGA